MTISSIEPSALSEALVEELAKLLFIEDSCLPDPAAGWEEQSIDEDCYPETAGYRATARKILSHLRSQRSANDVSERVNPPDVEIIIDEAVSMAQLDHAHPVDVRDWLVAKLRPWLSKPSHVPDGWKLVPKDPTPEMVRAGSARQSTATGSGGWKFEATETDIYRAMLSSSPPPPVSDGWQQERERLRGIVSDLYSMLEDRIDVADDSYVEEVCDRAREALSSSPPAPSPSEDA